MKTVHTSIISRLILGALCAISATGCGGEMLRTGRSPVFLTVTAVAASNGDDANNYTAFLLSDVRKDDGTVWNDNAKVTLRVEAKNQSVTTTPINNVTLTRYRVEFKRTDGKNVGGVDVPYGFDGTLSQTLVPGTPGDAIFELVRHQAKRESPLTNMLTGGGLKNLDVIADITIYGRDQNGNELMTTASIEIHFADFAG